MLLKINGPGCWQKSNIPVFFIFLSSIVTEIMIVSNFSVPSPLLKPFKWTLSLHLHLPFITLEGATIFFLKLIN